MKKVKYAADPNPPSKTAYLMIAVDRIGRALWRSGLDNCGCFVFTSPTQGATTHVCEKCFALGVEQMTEPQVQLTLELAAAIPDILRARGPS